MQVIWGHIWKRTVEKSRTNATNVTMPLLGQAIWGNIWKYTVEKSKTNATNATLPALSKVIWGDIWRDTDQCRREKSDNLPYGVNPLRTRIKAKQILSVWNQIDKININRFTFWRVKYRLQGTFYGVKNGKKMSIKGIKIQVKNRKVVDFDFSHILVQ